MDSTTPPRKDALIAAATADLARGFHSVRLVPSKKRPRGRGWNTLRLGAADLDGTFEDGDNRGRLLGVAAVALRREDRRPAVEEEPAPRQRAPCVRRRTT